MDIMCAHTERIPLHNLKTNPKNPNQHTDSQIKLLAKIMKHQGWRAPIVVSKRSGYITKGHGRLQAAKLNCWADAPVDMQDYASDADEYADMVADNEIARLAKSDLSMVLRDVLDLGPDFDFDLLGIPDFKLPEDFAIADLDDKENLEKQDQHFLEVQCANDKELVEIYDELLSRGLIVRYK